MIQDYLPDLITPAKFLLSFKGTVTGSGDHHMEILAAWRSCCLSYCDGGGLTVGDKFAPSEITALVRWSVGVFQFLVCLSTYKQGRRK